MRCAPFDVIDHIIFVALQCFVLWRVVCLTFVVSAVVLLTMEAANPMVLLPKHSGSAECLFADLGLISLSNRFRLVHLPRQPRPPPRARWALVCAGQFVLSL